MSIESATVQITSGFASPEDVLAFSNTASITGSWDSVTGTLTLTGTDSLANYEAALRAVTYENSSITPSTATRTVNFTVHDGDDASNLQSRNITVASLASAPQVDLDADDSSGSLAADFATTFSEDGGPVTIADSDATLSDVDSPTLASLQVVLLNQFDGASEILSADTSGTSIGASYSAGVLTLSGVDTVGNYQQVLRTISYENTSQDPNTTARVLTFIASDGSNSSNVATATVTMLAQNDAPIAAGESYSVDNDATLLIAGPGLLANDTDIDSPLLTAVLVTGPANGTLSLNADGSFTYTPLLTFIGSDTFVYAANDGSLDSAPVTVTLTVNSSVAPPPPTDPPVDPPVDPPDDSDEEEEEEETNDEPIPVDPHPIDEENGQGTGKRRGSSTSVQNEQVTGPLPAAPAAEAEPLDVLELVESQQAKGAKSTIGDPSSEPSPAQRFHSEDLASQTEFSALGFRRSLLWSQLDTLEEEIATEEEFASHVAGTATVVTAAISTGYVMWALRGSFLIASFLSTVPTWRSLDPLPILDGPGAEEEDRETLADIASSARPEQPEESAPPSLSARSK